VIFASRYFTEHAGVDNAAFSAGAIVVAGTCGAVVAAGGCSGVGVGLACARTTGIGDPAYVGTGASNAAISANTIQHAHFPAICMSRSRCLMKGF
jgi:hypothetical protein